MAAQPITPADDTDTDSSYDSDLASSTNSLTTSILAYRTIQGRTFHSDRTPAEYWFVVFAGMRSLWVEVLTKPGVRTMSGRMCAWISCEISSPLGV